MSDKSITDLIKSFDLKHFNAKVHYYLRHGGLSSEHWEKTVADSIPETKWVKGSTYLADAYNPEYKTCISVKSRKSDPQIKKRIDNRDFFSNPEHFHFGGTKFSEFDLENLHTVSRRCSIPNLDEQVSSAEDIGKVAIQNYVDFEKQSFQKFKCDKTLDFIIVHGESRDHKRYLIRVMFFTHHLNPITRWEDVKFDGPRTKYKGHRAMIVGHDGKGPHIGRISNLGRQQTCMFRFYRRSEALGIIETSIPFPSTPKFSLEEEITLIGPAEEKNTKYNEFLASLYNDTRTESSFFV